MEEGLTNSTPEIPRCKECQSVCEYLIEGRCEECEYLFINDIPFR